jgi:rhodanese-related sulfurtransferase
MTLSAPHAKQDTPHESPLSSNMAPGRIGDVDAATVKAWLHNDEAILIDVREEEEHAEENIPGAALHPLSRFDPTLIPQDPRKKAVLHCLVGSRSLKAAEMLVESGFHQVFHMEGGILAWIAAGGETRSAA